MRLQNCPPLTVPFHYRNHQEGAETFATRKHEYRLRFAEPNILRHFVTIIRAGRCSVRSLVRACVRHDRGKTPARTGKGSFKCTYKTCTRKKNPEKGNLPRTNLVKLSIDTQAHTHIRRADRKSCAKCVLTCSGCVLFSLFSYKLAMPTDGNGHEMKHPFSPARHIQPLRRMCSEGRRYVQEEAANILSNFFAPALNGK